MKVVAVPPAWHPGLPIFASDKFLKSVSDDFGWMGGIDHSGILCCVLPFTIVKKKGFRLVRFRVETIPCNGNLEMETEKLFLVEAMNFLRGIGGDVVIPATTNSIFRTFPLGADAAPYGSYVVDLCQPEDVLWRNIQRITRQNISSAEKIGVKILDGLQYLETAYSLIRETFKRADLPFMDLQSLRRYVSGLGDNCKLLIAELNGNVESCVIYAFSTYCAYAVYGGNCVGQHQGANKLLHWEAIRLFKRSGVLRYDFVGARIDPEKGSKQDALDMFKRHFGGTLKRGYIWKFPLRPLQSLSYNLAVRILRGGDIVDHERHKMESLSHGMGATP